jgi:hypothetical protein
MPIHFFDLTQLGEDDTDIRVISMQAAVGSAMAALGNAEETLKKRIAEIEKVEAEKKRLISGELPKEEVPVVPQA